MSATSSMNVMLAVYEKKTTATDVYRPIRTYISQNYSERDAISAEDDLEQIQTLRTHIQNSDSPPDLRRTYLTSYFKSLSLIEPRFPSLSISFTWHDAFKNNKKATISTVQFEKCAVLFNLGAVCSQIALAVDRDKGDGIKVACNAFQSAAGAFGFLKAVVVGLSGATVDLSGECAGMLERLMLAQAQECFFEKVIGDGKPNGICSKVARQVGLYYEEAYAALNSAPLNQHFDRAWVSHVQLKSAQFYAEACYRYSLELHSKDEIAEEIARLKIGLSSLTDAKKSAKGVTAPLLNAVSKLEENMKRNLERAMKENDRVYLQRVPAAGSLSTLPAASLVKPVNMAEVLDASKEKLFTGIVPDTSAKALSKYTEMVDDIIRTQAEKLQQGSEITRVRLKEMDLPDSILALEGAYCLPLDLKEDVEAVQISGGPSGLEAELQQLKDLRRVNQELLVQTEELLQKEASEDAQFRAQFGTRWTRPQSSTLTKNLQDRLNRFAGNLKQATESDARIERAVRENSALMSILDSRPIESALPTLARPIMSLDSNEDAIVGALKQSLLQRENRVLIFEDEINQRHHRQLENLGAQRAGLEDMLKEMKRKDDILPKLMAYSGSPDDLFRKEITKYDHICEEIAQNIEAQENLLLQIQAQNDEFAAVFNLEDYKVSRGKCYQQIAAAVAKYREIKDNINEGLKFYVTLQDAITNVKQQCSDFVMTRNIQCREMMEEVQRKISGLNFNTSAKTNYSATPAPPQHQPSPPYSHPPPSDYQRPGYNQPYPPPPYNPQPPPYHGPPRPYQHPPQQAHGHDYGQPAYPGWRGPYYNAHQAQPGQQQPPPPYSAQSPYQTQQSGYYRPPQ